MLIHFDSSRFQRMNPMTLVGFNSSFECYHSFYNFDICTTCQKKMALWFSLVSINNCVFNFIVKL